MVYSKSSRASDQLETNGANLQKGAAQFVDNRASSTTQLRLQGLMNASPQAIAQRKQQESMQSLTAQPIALQRVENEELLQGKFAIAQCMEDEELLQGKFATTQLMEDEELLQGKFETAQRVEDEELLQGKFETAQLMEEDELQAKFVTAQRMEEEEPLQGKFDALQRVEDEELLQGKFAVDLAPQVTAQLAGKPNNTGLPNQLKAGIESLSGMSMDHVKVHYNSDKPAQLNAHAYAQGSDIHVAAGQEQHLPHEAWHVVQQAQGRVKPTMQMKAGVPVNDDVGLETEADVMGAKAVAQGKTQVDSAKNKILDAGVVAQPIAQMLIDPISEEHKKKQHQKAKRKTFSESQLLSNQIRLAMNQAEHQEVSAREKLAEHFIFRESSEIKNAVADILAALVSVKREIDNIQKMAPTTGLPWDAGVSETKSYYYKWERERKLGVLFLDSGLSDLQDSFADENTDVDQLRDNSPDFFAFLVRGGKLTIKGNARVFGGNNAGEAYYFNESDDWTVHLHRNYSGEVNTAHYKHIDNEGDLGYNAINRVSNVSLVRLGINLAK